MNLLFISIIQITGTSISILFILALVFLIIWNLSKGRNKYKEDSDKLDDGLELEENLTNYNNNKFIDFHIASNTDEELTLDLCKLDLNDKRYSVSCGFGSYNMLVEYFKTNSLFVNMTRAYYNSNAHNGFGLPSWYKNIIYLKSYTPYSSEQRPVLIACDDIDKCQFQSNTIQKIDNYKFDYFNDLEIKLSPKTSMKVILYGSENLISYSDKPVKYQPLRCAISIVNNSTEKQTIELFDEKYFNEKLKDNAEVKIESLFSQVSYEEIIAQFKAQPLIATNFKFIVNSENHKSKLKVNLKEYELNGLISVNQFQTNVIDLPFDAETYIYNVSIEIEPNTEILISIK